MVKKIVLLLLAMSIFTLRAQDSSLFRYKSMLKATATISPGYLLNTTQTNIYLNGDVEYFPEERVSLRGESFVFLNAQQKPALLNQNSCLLFGALYHFHKNRFDYFIGLETGASLTKPNDIKVDSSVGRRGWVTATSSYTEVYNYKILPLISPVTGVTFYVNNYFNFFLNARYVKSRYYGYTNGKTLLLDEIRIAFGLGFQIHVKKK